MLTGTKNNGVLKDCLIENLEQIQSNKNGGIFKKKQHASKLSVKILSY
jgi:hypothetical protein